MKNMIHLDDINYRPQYALGGVGEFYRKLDENPWTLGAKTIVQALDPTGISGWVDAANAWEDYKNGNGSVGNALLETLGALPVLGAVGRVGKTFTAGNKARRLLRAGKKGQEAIDTWGELFHRVPGIGKPLAKATQGVQAVTGAIPDYMFRVLYNPYRSGRLASNAARRVDLRDIYNDAIIPIVNFGKGIPDTVQDYYDLYNYGRDK